MINKLHLNKLLYTNTIENFEILNCKFRQVISMTLNDKNWTNNWRCST